MAPAQMGYPAAPYPGFPGVPPSSSMMGGMMAPSVGMLAQPGATGMVTPMAIPAGYVGNVLGVPNGMMGAQQPGYVAGVAAVAQPVYGVQPAQQLQWNLAQVRGTRLGRRLEAFSRVFPGSEWDGGAGDRRGTRGISGGLCLAGDEAGVGSGKLGLPGVCRVRWEQLKMPGLVRLEKIPRLSPARAQSQPHPPAQGAEGALGTSRSGDSKPP